MPSDSRRYLAPRGAHAALYVLVTVDPGKWKSGVALWSMNDQLLAATTVAIPKTRHWRARTMWAAIERWVDDHTALPARTMPRAYGTEAMVDYRDKLGRRRDLDCLRAVVELLPRPLTRVTPFTYRRNVPKHAMRARADAALTPAERAALDKDHGFAWLAAQASHDMWDAIELGLYLTGRTRPGGLLAPNHDAGSEQTDDGDAGHDAA